MRYSELGCGEQPALRGYSEYAKVIGPAHSVAVNPKWKGLLEDN